MLSAASEDIRRRRPLREALSDLFPDTELQDCDVRYIARVIVASGYTDVEVEAILYGEVYPACIGNLRSPAGEWAGFDMEWLEARIFANQRRFWKRWAVFQTKRWMIRRTWRIVMAIVKEVRAGTPGRVERGTGPS